MYKVGDTIKFVDEEKYIENAGNSGYNPSYESIRLQRKIAGEKDKITRIVHNIIDDRDLYYTKWDHESQNYFFEQRFEKVNSINIPDSLFEL